MEALLGMILKFLGNIVTGVLIDQINRPGHTITVDDGPGEIQVTETKVQEALDRYGDL